MTIDLTVPMGEKLVLEEAAVSPEIAECLHNYEMRSLADLVQHGFIESQEVLRQLLTAAQTATRVTLSEGGPFKPIPGTTRRFDLQRFSKFIAAAPNIHPSQSQQFWKIVRDFEPRTLISKVKVETQFNEIGFQLATSSIIKLQVWKFFDVTIEPQATLVAGKNLNCRHLLIKKTGKLVAGGSGLYIHALSIEGQQ